MNFLELRFFILLVVTYALWSAGRSRPWARITVMLTASLVFCGVGHGWFIGMILAYALVDWTVGLWINRFRHPRLALTFGISLNLLPLLYWKYSPMLLKSAATLAVWIGRSPWQPIPSDSLMIPLGLSFYTFTGIAYLVDVYAGRARAEPNFGRFALFLSFFPRLTAGPILRSNDFLPALQPETLPSRPSAIEEAIQLLARGYFKKAVLADRIALSLDPFFANLGDPSTAGVWALPSVYLYALQIYFDFSGYTDIARGLGLLFGFRWPENFNLPYLATSVRDFWQRWHITLSTFLRDYLYIPLGGNRHGSGRSALALMVTMLLGGLWHGGSWSFMIWGGLHGVFLLIHRAWRASGASVWLGARKGIAGAIWQAISVLLTFHAVCLAWCFFRLPQLPQSLACLRQCVIFDSRLALVGGAADLSLWALVTLYGGGWLLSRSPWLRQWSYLDNGATDWDAVWRGLRFGFWLGLLVLAAILSPSGGAPPFIYFQF